MYNILERQLRGYFEKAVGSAENTGLKFIELLERRLDNVIYRLGLAVSRKQARQMVSHGLFQLNGKKMNIPSHLVKPGDVITIKKAKSLEKGFLSDGIKRAEKSESRSWLIWDSSDKKGQIISLPKDTDLEVGIDTRLIVEYYSR